jgi:spermidine synthase
MLNITFLACTLLPLVVILSSAMLFSPETRSGLGIRLLVGCIGALALNVLWMWLVRKGRLHLDALARGQTDFLEMIPERYLEIAIIGSAAVSLFLELAMIRWQGTVWEFFSFYKNLGLLSCFAGLGLGYALARCDRIPLVLTAPLLALQMLLLVSLRHGMGRWVESLLVTPFREQLNMGFRTASRSPHYVAVYSFLTVVFLLTALAFVPVGQLCGRLMERTSQLRAYRLNLLGSLAGVVVMMGISFLWTPPAIWFALCFAVLLSFQVFHRGALLTSTLSALAAIAILAWPVGIGWERIYSPYQLLERGGGERGLIMIRAAGHYYQRVHDLSYRNQLAFPYLRYLGSYYELPYRVHPRLGKVAIVGAGTGNDIAAALRAGAKEIDAIEIDPAIQALGLEYHPERPYADPRVWRITNDARSFLRTTKSQYDLIVYGLLDSHTLLSHASSVRLDSFVYTVEGLKEARARLKDDGIVSLSFSVISDELGRKIYLMMQEAFDGNPPVCVLAGYDRSVIFFQSRNGDLRMPLGVIEKAGFKDITAVYADARLKADISTDDWPFFYMPQRVYPTSYIFLFILVLGLSAGFFANFLQNRPRFSHASFFFLGAGFMLIETKAITEMGLTFGNTWLVIGIAIAGILIMAYLANSAVESFSIRKPLVPYLLLVASIGLGLYVAKSGGFPPTIGGKIVTAVILTCPMFFSGIVFSSLLAGTKDLAGAMAANLFGAMVGGVLEYNSMYFGFQSLYWIAIALYLAAALGSLLAKRKGSPAMAYPQARFDLG